MTSFTGVIEYVKSAWLESGFVVAHFPAAFSEEIVKGVQDSARPITSIPLMKFGEISEDSGKAGSLLKIPFE
jgi:hypothetical protein